MPENKGEQPAETKGKRVHVLLRNGYASTKADDRIGWAADTSRWSLEGHPFDIVRWKFLE